MSGYSKGYRRGYRDLLAAAKKSGEPWLMFKTVHESGTNFWIIPEGLRVAVADSEPVAKAFPNGIGFRAATGRRDDENA